MAHYGMFPDFLQDLKNVGLSAEDLAPLFRSAYDYVQMLDTCERRAVELKGIPPSQLQVPLDQVIDDIGL